jgi:hypothetical protein
MRLSRRLFASGFRSRFSATGIEIDAIIRSNGSKRDKVAAAHFRRHFGLGFDEQSDYFAAVRMNETLTLLFDEDTSFR